MSKNLYEKTLATAKHRKVGRIGQLEEKFNTIIIERCDRLLKDLKPWKKYEHFLTEFNDFVWDDLYQIATLLGYHVIKSSIGGFWIFIPEYTEGIKSTAQLMLSQFNNNFETRKFNTERLAQDACEYVITSLETGFFDGHTRPDGSCEIHVPMISPFADIMFGKDDEICKRVYQSEVERILTSEGFSVPTYYASTWVFS